MSDEINTMPATIRDLRAALTATEADAARLADALQKFPHNPLASTWTQSHVDWYWNVCKPALSHPAGAAPAAGEQRGEMG